MNRFLSEDVPHSRNVALLSVMYQYSGSQEKAEGIRGVYTRAHLHLTTNVAMCKCCMCGLSLILIK